MKASNRIRKCRTCGNEFRNTGDREYVVCIDCRMKMEGSNRELVCETDEHMKAYEGQRLVRGFNMLNAAYDEYTVEELT